MIDLPTGTVTFLFTDIEGSTRLWERHPEAMRYALARHDAMVRGTIAARSGVVFATVGDEFRAAFRTASDAVAAAIQAQRALTAEPWPVEGGVRVRMALHTAGVSPEDGAYDGATLGRIARLLAAGHGGQTLLSAATATLVRDAIPSGVALRDLGEHRLQAGGRAEHVHDLVGEGLRSTFLPLRTAELQPHNLPALRGPLVGRTRETEELRELLAEPGVSLITLTGPGGTGKTKLALHVAAVVAATFADGVFFVDLAPIDDPRLVIPTLAGALGTRDAGEQPLVERLQDWLRERSALLLFDNFEQVVGAASDVAELLDAAPNVKALVTSRVRLNVRAEREYPVQPLTVPEPALVAELRRSLPARPGTGTPAGRTDGAAEWAQPVERAGLAEVDPARVLGQYPAVSLFVRRAQEAKPNFALTDANAAAVAEICRRLDGLPLAIELAAARVKLLPPTAMLARLTRGSTAGRGAGRGARSGLDLLTGGARDLPARQQTLRATIGWSYDLLDAGEQYLFRHLAVFVGGFTLEAVDVLLGPDTPVVDPFDGVASLVDKSLVRQLGEDEDGGEPRFSVLTTIREFGLELLEAQGEAPNARRLHAEYFAALAEAAEPHLSGADQRAWLERLEREHDNLRAALAWSLGLQVVDEAPSSAALAVTASALIDSLTGERARLALRIVTALRRFWYYRGYFSEGRRWFEATLARYPLDAAFALGLDRAELAAFHAKARLVAARLALPQGDFARAREHLELSLALFRELDDRRGTSEALNALGDVALADGDGDRAEVVFAESLEHCRAIGFAYGHAHALGQLGRTALRRSEFDRAAELLEESLTRLRAVGDRWQIAWAARNLGLVEIYRGNHARAAEVVSESVAICAELGDRWGATTSLSLMAMLAAAVGQHARAARLFAATATIQTAVCLRLGPVYGARYEGDLATVRAGLGEAAFAAAWAEGEAMTLEAAVADGRRLAERLTPPAP